MSVARDMLAQVRGSGRAATMARVAMMRSVALAVGVLTGLLTARLLGPTGRGEQAAMVVAPQLLAGIGSLGLHASLIYNVRKDPTLERHYLGAALVMTILAGSAVAVIGAFAMPYWLHQYSPHVVRLAQLFLLVTPLNAACWSCTAAAESRGWFGLTNRAQWLQSFGVLAALLGLVAFGAITPGRSAAAYVLSNVAVAAYFAIVVGPRVRPVLTLRRVLVGRLLHYGLRFYGIDLLGTVSRYVDQVVVVALLSPALVGAYVVAQSLTRMLTVLQGAVSSVLFPSVAAQPPAVVVDSVARTMRVVSSLNAVIALVLAAAAPSALHFAFRGRYDAAAVPMAVLLADSVIINSAYILNQVYAASGRPGIITAFEVAGAATSVTAMLFLVPDLGLLGASLAILASSVVRLTCSVMGLRLVLRIKLPRLILDRSDLRPVFGR